EASISQPPLLTAACSGKLEQHTERRGVIYSPAWPLNYPPGTNCSWYIQGDRGDMITIRHDRSLLVPGHPPTSAAFSAPRSFRNFDAFRLCGSAIPPAFISARDHVWIFFHSDASSSGQAQGFRLSYIRGDAGGKLGQASCQADEFRCDNGNGAVTALRTAAMAPTRLAALTWPAAGAWAASMAPSPPQTCSPCGSSREGDVEDTGEQGCFSEPQRCDGWWHCASGRDEQGCPACPPDQYPCEGGSGLCYTPADRCNNQKSCPDGADEKNCFSCQPGTFHCGTNLCIFETWRCDGQEDCQDGSDEHGCLAAVPRKVITAALIGSLVCGLLLVIALGCAFKLYSLRTQEYRWAAGPEPRFPPVTGARPWAHCSYSCG
ncbi:hypothetical protein E2I00_018019, partial [Balaenoptera physalus]